MAISDENPVGPHRASRAVVLGAVLSVPIVGIVGQGGITFG